MEQRVNNLETDMSRIKTEVAVLQTQHKHMNDKLDDIVAATIPMAEKVTDMHTQMATSHAAIKWSWKTASTIAAAVVTVISIVFAYIKLGV